MTATAPVRIAPTETQWSDGQYRSQNFHGTDLQRAIAEYFGERSETEIRRLKFENETMRDQIEARTKGATV